MDFEFCIFSYNRGDYLRNCLESLHHGLPTTRANLGISIYDDNSDDPKTVALLATVAEPVVTCAPTETSETGETGWVGGLHANMQLALERSKADFLVFIQDDAQMVRPLSPADFKEIEDYFRSHTDAGFLNHVFLRGGRRRSIMRQLRPRVDIPGYECEISERWKRRSVTMYYCDMCIVFVDRLRSAGIRFEKSEDVMAETVRQYFPKMIQMAHPFVAHVPEVPVYRGKKQTLASKWAERITGTDVKAFRMMSDKEVIAMKTRDLAKPPFAEDFLHTKNVAVRKPYVYSSVRTNIVTRALHKLEVKLQALRTGQKVKTH